MGPEVHQTQDTWVALLHKAVLASLAEAYPEASRAAACRAERMGVVADSRS